MFRKTKISLCVARVVGVFKSDELTPEYLSFYGKWSWTLYPWQNFLWGCLNDKGFSEKDFQYQYGCDFAADGSKDSSVCVQILYSRRLGKSFIQDRWDVSQGRNK